MKSSSDTYANCTSHLHQSSSSFIFTSNFRPPHRRPALHHCPASCLVRRGQDQFHSEGCARSSNGRIRRVDGYRWAQENEREKLFITAPGSRPLGARCSNQPPTRSLPRSPLPCHPLRPFLECLVPEWVFISFPFARNVETSISGIQSGCRIDRVSECLRRGAAPLHRLGLEVPFRGSGSDLVAGDPRAPTHFSEVIEST